MCFALDMNLTLQYVMIGGGSILNKKQSDSNEVTQQANDPNPGPCLLISGSSPSGV